MNRLSFFDTEIAAIQEKWDDATKREVEERLLGGMSYGIDYFLSEKPVAPVPYAKYLDHRKVHGQRKIDHAIQDILAAIDMAGIDPALVLDYERDGRNSDQFSEQIIKAVEAVTVEDEPEPLIAA